MIKMKVMSAAAMLAAVLTLALPGLAQQAPTLAPPATVPPPAVAPSAPSPPVSSSSAGHALSREDAQSWLDGFLPYAMDRGDIAGAVVVVVKDDQVLLQKGYGFSDVARRKPVDPDNTMFRPGSVSKLYTWTAVMQQVEQGKIDLDRDINAYLDFAIPPFQGRPVTMRDLMTHTGGCEEAIKNLIAAVPAPVLPLGPFLKNNVPARVFPAGQVPAYSNFGAALAGYIVQRVSGQAFDAYVEQHIFAPLGMRHASFRQPLPANLRALMSDGYDLGSGPPRPFEEVGPAPAGSAAMSGADMASFMIAHLRNGAYRGQRILRDATAVEMHGTPLTVIPPLRRMLLGFYEMNRNGHRIIGHEGDTRWFHSELALFPDDHAGIFISMNSAGSAGVTQPIRVALLHGFADRYFPGPMPQAGAGQGAARPDPGGLNGTYYSSRGSQTNFMSLLDLISYATVSHDAKGQLVASPVRGLNDVPLRFVEAAPSLWREVGGQDRLAARTANGRVVMWSEDGESPWEVYLPVHWYKNPSFFLPAMIASIAALLLSGLLWPVRAVVRRRHRARFALQGVDARSYRLVRVAALAAGILMVAWWVTLLLMVKTYSFSDALDPLILALHGLSIIVFPVAFLIALWNAWVLWSRRRGWRSLFARLWGTVLAGAACILLWVASAFHLIGVGLNY